jgi:gamma-glutamyltranspeptidase/glutathione hydrolase
MVAAAATIAVVYPHMNSIGGDCFWLIVRPGAAPIGIQACGPAGRNVTVALYRDKGLGAIPARRGLAANTVAGATAGWIAALEVSGEMGGSMPLDRLLEDSIFHAEHGFPLSRSFSETLVAKGDELRTIPGFAGAFTPEGQILKQPRLAAVLRALARAGLDDFYRGEVGRRIAADLADAGSPLTAADLESYHARRIEPLSIRLRDASVYNLPPPTQGLASLIILGLFERMAVKESESFEHVHAIVEATKRAFLIRDSELCDPALSRRAQTEFLAQAELDRLCREIKRDKAMPWPHLGLPGDTVWMGAIDRNGCAVSFIQSLYWEFGSGVVLKDTGILWQNRGSSFSLQEGARNQVAPGRLPVHTLNPAAALFDDGRVMVYGAMGGDGQPQTQAAVFTRYARFGLSLPEAVAAPRWLLGRTWGAETTTLKIESDFAPEAIVALRRAGHEIELIAPCNDLTGHAGAVVRGADGVIEGAADPRSDGSAAGF